MRSGGGAYQRLFYKEGTRMLFGDAKKNVHTILTELRQMLYWGKPAVRNLRGDDGNVGIIRSPVRAIVLPDPRSYPTEGGGSG